MSKICHFFAIYKSIFFVKIQTKGGNIMIKALEDFIMVLHEEADTPQQKQMLNETLQRSIR